MLCLTMGGSAPMYEPDGVNGDIEQIPLPIRHGRLGVTGFRVLSPFISWSVACVTDAERQAYLDAWPIEGVAPSTPSRWRSRHWKRTTEHST